MRSFESQPFFIIFYIVLTNFILAKSDEEERIKTTISPAVDGQQDSMVERKENITLKPAKTSAEEYDRYSKYLAERERILEKFKNLDASIISKSNQYEERKKVDEGTGEGMSTFNGATASNELTESIHHQSSSSDYSLPSSFYSIQSHLPSPFYYIQPEYSIAPYQQQQYYSPYNYGGNGYGGGYYYPSSYYQGGGYGSGMPWGGYGGFGNLFNLGIGWNFNLGLPSLGTGVGVGSGLGVNVG